MSKFMKKLRHIAPYDFRYRMQITKELAGHTLYELFENRFSYKPVEYWVALWQKGNVSINHQKVDLDYTLKLDDVMHTLREDVQEPPVNDEIEVLFDEEGILILNKKAPIPVHPSGRYFKNALTSILKEHYPEKKFHTIHRLDLWTTGVLILATTPESARCLHLQVEKQRIKKSYGVLAIGDFGQEEFTITAPIGRVQGAHRGFGDNITEAKDCLTKFTPLYSKKVPGTFSETPDNPKLIENTLTFLKAEPLTGRTNQIRVHIQAAGGYILNDPLYSPHPQKEERIPFLGLHCREMEFMLPSGKTHKAIAPWPEEFLEHFNDI